MRIFYLHITKCGGSSLREALTQATLQSGASPQSIFHLDGAAATKTARDANQSGWEIRDAMLKYLLQSRYQRFVTGHFRYLPDLHDEVAENWRFMTVLREPEERLLSLYYFSRYQAGHYAPVSGSLEAFIETPEARREGAAFVHCLVDKPVSSPKPAAEEVEAACQNLGRFPVLGILEDLPALQKTFLMQTGASLNIGRLNTNPAGALREQVIAEPVLEKIRALCAPSRAVYEHACGVIRQRQSDHRAVKP